MQFVASRIRDRSMREDVVQETWLRMLKYDRAHTIGNWPALARKIALNLIRDHFRAEKLHPTEEINDSQPSPVPLQEQTLMYRQKLGAFQAVLAEMPPLRRNVLIARRIHGKSYQEISAELNLSPQAVEKHMTRALCQLHNALQEHPQKRAGSRQEEKVRSHG